MNRKLLAPLAGASLLLALAGCGSSSKSPGASTSSAVSLGSTSTGGPGTPSSAGTASATTTPSGSNLKVTGKPKYGSPPASTPVQSGTVEVAYREISIHPDTLKVKVGSTVRWTNYDPIEHNVTSEGGPQQFASKNFGEGASFSVTFTKPGVVHYLCTIHPASMNGTIVVVK